ncbi:GntR family transcriptional regulator [Pelomicrobium sp.]|uniref:GntR family transcriptional regulator n=1 Tax=Pelomicrobium sp. TaxID=2815319 RepID=UPI002FDE2551
MSAQITPFPSPDKVIDRRPLHHEATARLRDMIVQGELAPGARLNERVLCQQLGISRTPLREALKVLAAEGLVELLPNRGAVVTQLTLRAVQEIFEVMGALERLAGELVCRNATEADIAEIRALHYQMMVYYARGDLAGYFRYNQQIHLKLVESTGNATLAATYRNLNAHVRRARYMANLSRERWDKAVQEHEEILDALMKRDSARLQGLLQDHLGHKMLVVLEALNAPSAPAQAATP